MLEILPPAYSGAVAQVVLERFYAVQFWCCGIALSHLLMEWLYAGKPLRHWPTYLVLGLLALSLLSGLIVQPKLKRLHRDVYGVRSTPAQREQGRRSTRLWEGTLQFANFMTVAGLWVYLWRINSGVNSMRFVSAGKLRGLTNGVS
jgi:hypothetical protein